MRQALYGHGGFFHRPEGPAGHFRTSVHASPLFAAAVLRLLADVDTLLDHPSTVDLVDVGAGRGELLLAVRDLVRDSPLAGRVRLRAVELADAPYGLPDDVGWSAEPPEAVRGLVVANEWLDDVPVDVVELGVDGVHSVLVEPATGVEAPGGPVGLRDAAWLARWWPLDGADQGSRAEVGLARDDAWSRVVGSIECGVAVAVDYGHLLSERVAGRYAEGTLVGYRDGRRVAAVPDGSCDITAHVAIDACAAAGRAAGAEHSSIARQRDVLTRLGVHRPRPPVDLARADPAAYASGLQASAESGELRDPSGLGAFWWLAQSVGVALPDAVGVDAVDEVA